MTWTQLPNAAARAPVARSVSRPANASVKTSWLLGAFLAIACGRAPLCDADGNCDCSGRRECVVSCPPGGCDVKCNQTSETCGVVCDEDCTFECRDTNHCSSFSGARSNLTCHQTSSCAAECGPECNFSCFDTSTCTTRLGPGSRFSCEQVADCEPTCVGNCDVTCTDTSRCLVTCDGPCEVNLTCTQVANCDVSCPAGLQHTGDGNGVHTCE